MKYPILITTIVATILAMYLISFSGCSSDDDDDDATTTDTDTTDNDSGEDSSGASYTCENCECLPNNSTRPNDIFTIIEALLAALEGKGDPGNTYVGVMSNHKSGFWDTPLLGYNKAKSELGIMGDWSWPPDKSDPLEDIIAAQQAYMADWIDDTGDLQVASAIGLSCKSGDELKDSIDNAIDAGVPVITFDSDSDGSKRHLYLGSLNEILGETAGNTMLDLLGDPTGKKVLVLAGQDTETHIVHRQDGIDIAFADHPDVLDVKWGTTDDNAVATLEAALTEHGTALAGIISLNGTFGPISADWIIQESLTDQISIVGWEATDAQLAHIENGVIQAAMAQRAYFFGYLTTYILYAMKVLGVDETMTILSPYLVGDNKDLLNTGVDVVTPDNLGEYNTYQMDCLGRAVN